MYVSSPLDIKETSFTAQISLSASYRHGKARGGGVTAEIEFQGKPNGVMQALYLIGEGCLVGMVGG
jgi:hypothetical protein